MDQEEIVHKSQKFGFIMYNSTISTINFNTYTKVLSTIFSLGNNVQNYIQIGHWRNWTGIEESKYNKVFNKKVDIKHKIFKEYLHSEVKQKL